MADENNNTDSKTTTKPETADQAKTAPKAKAKVKGLPAVLMTLVASTLASTRKSLMIGRSESITG